MPSKKKTQRRRTVLVVPHTHWDRAWFWPLERFRVRLAELFDVLLSEFRNHPDYRFTLDGQTVIVEDYLEAHPEHRPELKRLGQAGRLKMGPMYVLADLYCTGGEALIRNLLIGRRIADEFGARQETLHMPDTFGIVPCIPAIAAGFGIPVFTFMRGVAGERPGMTSMESDASGITPPQIPDGTRMFLWSSPDGSQVRVMRLRDGYANAARLGMVSDLSGIAPRFDEAKAVAALLAAAERQDDAQGDPLLLLAGVDHQIPQPQLTDLMRQASERSHYDFRYAGLDDMAQAMGARDAAAWPRYQGEFHGSGAASVLGGTVSSRIYLKQTNAAIERQLVQVAEPGAALACLVTGRRDPGFASLGIAWKHLLQTHPHDNICGCSVDAVHRDDEYRMRQAADAADAVRRRAARLLMGALGGNRPRDDRYSFFLFDAQANPRRARVRVRLDCEGRRNWGDYRLPEHYAIVDDEGREVPYIEIERGQSVEHPHTTALVEVDVALRPTTVERFYVEPREASGGPVHPKLRIIENARLRVEGRPNGTFDLTDKATGHTYPGLGVFSDQADVGDTYDFADIPTEQESVQGRRRFQVHTLAGHAGLKVLRLRGQLIVPATSEKSGRSKHRVVLPLTVILSLGPDSPHVECRVAFENTACDHRLRFNLPLPFQPRESRAGLKFGEVTRPAGQPPEGAEAPRVHPEHPADEYVAVEAPWVDAEHPASGVAPFESADWQGGRPGLALFSEFPFNYEIVTSPAPRLAVTLVRSVGFLSRGDMATRKGNAGPDTPTPEAQCLGRHFDIRFAIRPYVAGDAPFVVPASAGPSSASPFVVPASAGPSPAIPFVVPASAGPSSATVAAGESAGILREAMLWRALPFHGLVEGYDPPRAGAFEEPFVEVVSSVAVGASGESAADGVPAADGPVVSAFKPRDVGEGTLVRLFNPGARSLSVRLRVHHGRHLVPLGLHEEPVGEPLDLCGKKEGLFEVTLPPYGLRTYGIERRSDEGRG